MWLGCFTRAHRTTASLYAVLHGGWKVGQDGRSMIRQKGMKTLSSGLPLTCAARLRSTNAQQSAAALHLKLFLSTELFNPLSYFFWLMLSDRNQIKAWWCKVSGRKAELNRMLNVNPNSVSASFQRTCSRIDLSEKNQSLVDVISCTICFDTKSAQSPSCCTFERLGWQTTHAALHFCCVLLRRLFRLHDIINTYFAIGR